ncbi:MAG: NCS2 family permease [Candidatus Delongbacteria bacterium]|nr:NCS2 family permease [Candidatus Delongbacteria bacterium]
MLQRYFRIQEAGSTLSRELLGGLTTFVTMAYIIVVNPKILEVAGIPFGPAMVATIISAFFGTLAMGLYARRPFAIAPYMGENAFIAFTVVNVLGYSWQTALGAIFIGGVLFTLITVLKIRSWLARSIPLSLKIAFAAGIGFFLIFIGLNETGLVILGVPGAPVQVGDLHDSRLLLALVGILLTAVLMIRRVPGAILISILLVTVIGFLTGEVALPQHWVSLPPSIAPIMGQLDIMGALTWGFFPVILTVLVMDFVDTMGTLLGVGLQANLLDEEGNLPEIEKPMLCDSLATVVGAWLGTTTTGTYIESAAGIRAGGRTGLSAVVTALLFLLALFFYPFLTVVPAFAYGAALVIVGILMMAPLAQLNFKDLTEVIPAISVVAGMSFTYNLGIGLTAGFVIYPLLKTAAGQWREINNGLWLLCAVSLLFYLFYPG